MEGTQLGPYRLLSELGSGGMGTVHAAEVAEAVAGLEPGQKVAVKIVHPHLLASPGFFKRFLREAELGRKVVHENVVRTFDVDALLVDDRSVHYMVMEYVEGKSLRQLLLDLGSIPETLLREIALQTAAGLAAIHAAGIVHRDLKPENVLITDDHEIRIMDLGVAKLQEASVVITLEGQFAGSLLHAAPEQFGAGEVGPAADLYSLGVTLYELATGDNPFRRDEAGAVMQAHLELEPPRLTDRNPDVTTFLAELVAKLLAKRPGDRFESAQVLHDVLAAGERSAWWAEFAPRLRAGVVHLPKIRVRRDTLLHGRDAELKLLRDAWDRAQRGEGNTVFFEGEAGIGKTRLLDAFVRGLDGDDVHVLYGSHPPSGGLGGLSDAVLDKFGEADLEGALAPYLTVTPSLVPAFAAFVKHDTPPAGADALQGDALLAVSTHLMRALAEEKPLLWMIEDLQFASRESRDVALALARAADDHRVLLVATARPGVPEDELANFSRLESLARVSLGRLGAREVIELLEDAFRSEALAEKLGAKIASKSDGVPFFVVEMIRGLKQGQFIHQLPDGSYIQSQVIEELEVPSAVRDLIEGRLRGLGKGQRAILDVGAVGGMTFDPGLVAAVLDEKRIRVLRELADIERRDGLVHGEAGHTRFDQNQIQEVLYGDLTPDLRAEYHTLLAEAQAARLHGEVKPEDAVFLASHHLRGSRPEKGRPHLAPALAHLESCYRHEAAIGLAAQALAIPALLEGAERAEMLIRKAERHGVRGDTEPQRAALEEALALALADAGVDATLEARTHIHLGRFLYSTGAYAAATDSYRRALELARQGKDKQNEDLALRGLGLNAVGLSRYEEAREHFERALALARETGDEDAEAANTTNLGLVFWRLSRYEEARRSTEQGLALARACGNRLWESRAAGNLGLVLYEQGNYEEAQAQLGRFLALAREMGYRRDEVIGTQALGTVYQAQGLFDEARAHYERCLALAREIGDRTLEAMAIGNLGSVAGDLGLHEQARDHDERFIALARKIGDRAAEAGGTGNLGLVFLNQGRYEDARAQFGRYLALSREIGHGQGQIIATGNLGLCLLRLGRLEDARQRFCEQLALAREQGNRRQEGFALESAALLAETEGDSESAVQLYEEALARRRELGEKNSVAASLLGLGALERRRGDAENAAAHLDEALELAREIHQPRVTLMATVQRVLLPGGDIGAAVSALADHEERAAHAERMEARFLLWELTGDRIHLEEAHRLLRFALDHTPKEYRDSMTESVPLHRDIMKAWEEHG